MADCTVANWITHGFDETLHDLLLLNSQAIVRGALSMYNSFSNTTAIRNQPRFCCKVQMQRDSTTPLYNALIGAAVWKDLTVLDAIMQPSAWHPTAGRKIKHSCQSIINCPILMPRMWLHTSCITFATSLYIGKFQIWIQLCAAVRLMVTPASE